MYILYNPCTHSTTTYPPSFPMNLFLPPSSHFYDHPSTITAYRRLSAPAVFPALVAGVGLVFFQQVTGQPSVLYYADSIFEDVGLSTFASILVSLFKLVATLFATFTVDSHGRKLLLYIGCSLMLVALVALGTAFLFPYTSMAQCNSFTSDAMCGTTCMWDTSKCGFDTCADAGFEDAVCTCCRWTIPPNRSQYSLTPLYPFNTLSTHPLTRILATYPLHISSPHTFSTSSPHTVPVAYLNKKPSPHQSLNPQLNTSYPHTSQLHP